MTRKSEGQGQLNALSIICIDQDFDLVQNLKNFTGCKRAWGTGERVQHVKETIQRNSKKSFSHRNFILIHPAVLYYTEYE